VESDEEKEIVGIVYNYPRSTDWPKEKTDDLLKDIDIPESLLAYAEEIDISCRQLGEFKGGELGRLIIHIKYM